MTDIGGGRGRAVLMCLSGLDIAQFVERAAPHIPTDRPLILLYVIDTRPVEELGYLAQRLHAAPGALAGREDVMLAAEQQTADEVLAEAQARLAQLGYSQNNIHRLVLKGRPEREIVNVVERRPDIGLVVIGAGYKRGPHPLTGPASIGHVARFVVDHCPCDLLLLK